jgi:hypothetical protein
MELFMAIKSFVIMKKMVSFPRLLHSKLYFDYLIGRKGFETMKERKKERKDRKKES